MRIGDRDLKISDLHKKVIPFARILWGIRNLENPIHYLLCYLKRESPGQVRFKNGLKINLSSNPHDTISVAVVFLQKNYGTVEPHSVVMDIGANIGTFSLYAAYCGASTVFAIEPNKEAYEVLCKNIKDNKFDEIIYPVNCAISDSVGQVGIPKNSSPYNKTIEPSVVANHTSTDYDMVAADSISNFMKTNDVKHIDLLKMDCEGAEFSILPSFSKDTWDKISKIRMEYHQDPKKLIDLSHRHNFSVVRMVKHSETNGDLWLTNCAT